MVVNLLFKKKKIIYELIYRDENTYKIGYCLKNISNYAFKHNYNVQYISTIIMHHAL